ncbi:histidine phosphatase family protein [Actinomadura welshii]
MQLPRRITARYIRHAESVSNIEGYLSHRCADLPLSPLGQRQVVRLAGGLATDVPIGTVILSSPLRRAVETAHVIALALGTEVQIMEELRELDVGDLDGKNDAASWLAHNAVLDAWDGGDAAAAFPGGECMAEASMRICKGLVHAAAVEQLTNASPLIVAHGGILRAAMSICSARCDLLRHIENCGEVKLEYFVDNSGTVRDLLVSRP